MSVRCALYIQGKCKTWESMRETLRRETEAGRIELVCCAGKDVRTEGSWLQGTAYTEAGTIMDFAPDYVFLIEADKAAEAKKSIRHNAMKRLLPGFLVRLGRRLTARLQTGKNMRRWKSYDGWGNPIPRHPEMTFSVYDPMKEFSVPPEKVIPGRTLCIPGFHMERYILLRKQGVTFLSDNCWGGIMYNTLGLEMTSPFINMMIGKQFFYKLLENLPYYLSQPLVPLRPRKNKTSAAVYPIVLLGDIEMHFNHADTPEKLAEYAEKWYRRRERMDMEHLFLETCYDTRELEEEWGDRFFALPYNKIAFVPYPTERKNEVFLPDYEKYKKTHFKDGFRECSRACAKNELPDGIPYDFLKTYLTGKVQK